MMTITRYRIESPRGDGTWRDMETYHNRDVAIAALQTFPHPCRIVELTVSEAVIFDNTNTTKGEPCPA